MLVMISFGMKIMNKVRQFISNLSLYFTMILGVGKLSTYSVHVSFLAYVFHDLLKIQYFVFVICRLQLFA